MSSSEHPNCNNIDDKVDFAFWFIDTWFISKFTESLRCGLKRLSFNLLWLSLSLISIFLSFEILIFFGLILVILFSIFFSFSFLSKLDKISSKHLSSKNLDPSKSLSINDKPISSFFSVLYFNIKEFKSLFSFV